LMFWLLVVATSAAAADPVLDKVVDLYSMLSCNGCHMGETARDSLAHFTTLGGPRELLKSFAYRHYKMRDRVAKTLGEDAIAQDRFLESPAIDPYANGGKDHGSLSRMTDALGRDGEEVTQEEIQTLADWFDQGAPLPQDVLDEVFSQIKSDFKRR